MYRKGVENTVSKQKNFPKARGEVVFLQVLKVMDLSALKSHPLLIWLNPVTLGIPSEDLAFHILAIHHENMVGGELTATDEG